eukprot:jgi/Psemu1/324602/estExt_fgenesh1_pg.C_1600014
MQTGSGSPLSKRQKPDHEDNFSGSVPVLDINDPNDGKISLLLQPCAREPKSLHIAPMIRVSNREFRQLIRILSKRCVLWTEMVVDETIYYCSRSKSSSSGVTADGIKDTGSINKENVDIHLGYDRSVEHPIVCQIGGIHPAHTAFTSQIVVKEYGYDEVNLNMGCPSNRVSGKGFGAVLMKNIDGACDLVRSLKHNCGNVPISVKLRIGVDDMEDFDFIREIIRRLHEAGCDKFYMHARKVLLKGLNPAENRIVPPLNYPIVYRLCEEFPQCDFWINGGISGLRAAKALVYGDDEKEPNVPGSKLADHSVPCALCNYPNGSCIAPLAKDKVPANLRGCMLGRAAMDNPSLFWDCDRYFYGEAKNPCRTRREVLDQYIAYLEKVYPRRCCDEIDFETKRIPAPSLIHTGESCSICAEWRKAKAMHSPTSKISTKIDHASSISNAGVGSNGSQKKRTKKTKPKITTHVVRRALRPVLGIFVGLSTSKIFRRRCEDLTQDLAIRECGPAFVLVSALQSVPDEFLDAKFIRTEDLPASNIVEHVSPEQCSC